MSDPHAAFIKAQKEYDNRMPPEAPESCKVHEWEYDPGEPNEEGCPYCIADTEDFLEMRAEDRRHQHDD